VRHDRRKEANTARRRLRVKVPDDEDGGFDGGGESRITDPVDRVRVTNEIIQVVTSAEVESEGVTSSLANQRKGEVPLNLPPDPGGQGLVVGEERRQGLVVEEDMICGSLSPAPRGGLTRHDTAARHRNDTMSRHGTDTLQPGSLSSSVAVVSERSDIVSERSDIVSERSDIVSERNDIVSERNDTVSERHDTVSGPIDTGSGRMSAAQDGRVRLTPMKELSPTSVNRWMNSAKKDR